ncbi:MAG: sugar phosphate isomerase/epimerase family protein, partial [Acidobacteriota bacterium]
PGKMVLSIHQTTSRNAGYQGSLEGWAKAGIKYVEIESGALDGFLKTETIETARKVITDLGLTPVSGAAVLADIWIPGTARAASLETWKKRCEQFAGLGLRKIYCPSITNRKVTADDFKATPEAIRESGDIAKSFNLTAMIEFARTSTHLATLSSALTMIREANHPNVRPMLDCFHFWSGWSKFEDLDMLKPGELAHVHFQDILDTPRELIDNNGRVIPGDGVAPLVKILQKLKEKQYAGPLSVELFLARLTGGDAQATGAEIKQKCDAVMQKAGVV